MGTLDLALNKLEKIITHDSTIENVKKKKKINSLPSKMQISTTNVDSSVKSTLQSNKRLLCMSRTQSSHLVYVVSSRL